MLYSHCPVPWVGVAWSGVWWRARSQGSRCWSGTTWCPVEQEMKEEEEELVKEEQDQDSRDIRRITLGAEMFLTSSDVFFQRPVMFWVWNRKCGSEKRKLKINTWHREKAAFLLTKGLLVDMNGSRKHNIYIPAFIHKFKRKIYYWIKSGGKFIQEEILSLASLVLEKCFITKSCHLLSNLVASFSETLQHHGGDIVVHVIQLLETRQVLLLMLLLLLLLLFLPKPVLTCSRWGSDSM